MSRSLWRLFLSRWKDKQGNGCFLRICIAERFMFATGNPSSTNIIMHPPWLLQSDINHHNILRSRVYGRKWLPFSKYLNLIGLFVERDTEWLWGCYMGGGEVYEILSWTSFPTQAVWVTQSQALIIIWRQEYLESRGIYVVKGSHEPKRMFFYVHYISFHLPLAQRPKVNVDCLGYNHCDGRGGHHDLATLKAEIISLSTNSSWHCLQTLWKSYLTGCSFRKLQIVI